MVLASLGSGSKHGYAIRKNIKEDFGRSVGQGALYGSLNALVAKGLIVALEPIANKQPFEITEAGRVQLKQSLGAMRKLAEVTPVESSPRPSFYESVGDADIDKEVARNVRLPKVVDPLSIPFSQLGGRRFEILTYLLKREEEADDASVTLVKASRDGGRDVLVHRNSKLFAVIQCKNLQGKLSLLSLQEELLKLVLHDYRERFIQDTGLSYEIWAPGGLATSAEEFVNSGRLQFQEDNWVEVFTRITQSYKKLSSLQWNDVREHVRGALTKSISMVFHDGLTISQKVQSSPILYARFFDVVNVWKKEDVQQTLNPQLNQIAAGVQQLTAAAEGSVGDQIDEQINEVRELISAGHFEEAQATLRILERKKSHLFTNRQRFRVESNKGAIAYSQTRLEDAAQCFLHAIRLQPDDERAQENEVFAYYLLRDTSKAHALATQRKDSLPSSSRIASLWINTAPPSMSTEELVNSIQPTLLDQSEVALALARRYMGVQQLDAASRFAAAAKSSVPKWSQPWLVEAQIAVGKVLEENAGMRQIDRTDRASLLQEGIAAATRAAELSQSDGNWAKAEALTVRSQLYLI